MRPNAGARSVATVGPRGVGAARGAGGSLPRASPLLATEVAVLPVALGWMALEAAAGGAVPTAARVAAADGLMA